MREVEFVFADHFQRIAIPAVGEGGRQGRMRRVAVKEHSRRAVAVTHDAGSVPG